jgi:hypothetical protein
MTTPNLGDWQTRTVITVPIDDTAVFEEVDGRMMATVRILKAGMSKNRRTYPPHVVKEAVDKHLFDGIRMFINHDRKRPDPNDRSLSEMVSAIESTSYDDVNQAMDGRVEFFDRAFYDKVRAAKDYLGVSINALVKGTRRLQGGQVYEDVSGWTKPRSVDWVTFPAAGGAILAFEDEDEPPMLDWTTITAEELKKNNQAVFESIQAEAREAALAEAKKNQKGPEDDDEDSAIISQESIQQMIADGIANELKNREAQEKVRLAKQRTASEQIRDAFEKSGLPTRTRARVMASFEGVEEFDSDAVAEAIKEAKEELNSAGAGPIIRGMGPSGAGDSTPQAAVFSVHESVASSFGLSRKSADPKEGTK